MLEIRPRCIVVVDDDEAVRNYLHEVLSMHGHTTWLFSDGQSALRKLMESGPESSGEAGLVLCDINMPVMNGLELLGAVRALSPRLPFILLSGLYEKSVAMNALQMGATDYLLKPAKPEDVAAMAERHLRKPKPESDAIVRSTLANFLNRYKSRSGNNTDLLFSLFGLLGLKRFETLQHSQRVAGYSTLVGVRYGLDADALRQLEIGALLHDIGKAAIPHNVLMKPGSLNSEEWRVMKTHPVIGAELLAGIPEIGAEAKIVHCHHERVDGTGYPMGLRLNEIPVGARIFAVADALDAITSDRPYRAARSIASARSEIDRCAGTHFDPQVVEAFRQVSDQAIENVRTRFPHETESPEWGNSPCEVPVLPDYSLCEA